MSDSAVANISASINLEEIRAVLKGQLNYTPAASITNSSGEGWVFGHREVHSSANYNLFTTSHDFQGGSHEAVSMSDKIIWLAVYVPKGEETSGTQNIDDTQGIVITLDNNTSNSWDDTDGFVVAPGELWISKLNRPLTQSVHARACMVDEYGMASANTTFRGTYTYIASILENVA